MVLAEANDFGVFGEAATHGELSDDLHGQSEQVSAERCVLGFGIRLPLFNQLLNQLQTGEQGLHIKKKKKRDKPRNAAAFR